MSLAAKIVRTQVGIVGAGPAGLMLARLLARAGIDSVVVDHRSRETIETTVRAGILEADSVALLEAAGAADGVHRNGVPHEGVVLRFDGENHRIDFEELVGASVWLYQQTDLVADLARHHSAAGGELRYGISELRLSELVDAPQLNFVDSDGTAVTLDCEFVVGADGSRSFCRKSIPEQLRSTLFREYPYAWFGILAEAPKSDPELIYAQSARGFALISQRSETLQRMYFQCDPGEDAAAWSEEQIWAELRERVNGNGFELAEGAIVERVVLPFRSTVQTPMRYGKLLLAGDAAHTVPPTGAKGLNLALADVKILAEGLVAQLQSGQAELLSAYPEKALDRVWKAQHFSSWMTQLLHRDPSGSDFDQHRQRAELRSMVESRAGSSYLAEGYTGWPQARDGQRTPARTINIASEGALS